MKNKLKEFTEELKGELDKINIKTASGRNRLPSLVLGEVSEKIDNLYEKYSKGKENEKNIKF